MVMTSRIVTKFHGSGTKEQSLKPLRSQFKTRKCFLMKQVEVLESLTL